MSKVYVQRDEGVIVGIFANIQLGYAEEEIDRDHPDVVARLNMFAIPSKTSKLGIKRALEELDMWDDVKAAIAANPSIQEEWELAVEISRNDPLTQSMIATLGMTPEQIDQLILRANELTS